MVIVINDDEELLLVRYDKKKRKTLYAYTEDKEVFIGSRRFVVPAFFWFDGSTVPRFAWGLIAPGGRTRAAGALHDYLYDTKGRGWYGEYNLTRRQIDRLFYLHLLQLGTPRAQAKLMYVGVRTPIAWLYWRSESGGIIDKRARVSY